ncbi:MBL fold metallo-hydrolase [Endobacter medicaginis]
MPLSVEIIPVTPLRQNCLILHDKDRPGTPAVVVDPGGDVPRILERLAASGARVGEIWLTHGHLDHAGGAAELREALAGQPGGPPPVIGPDRRDAFLLDEIETQAAQYGLSGLRRVTPDRFVVEGEVLRAGDLAFEVLHVPGHTPGHVVFVARAARFAIVGDTLFAGGVGRTDFAYGNSAALLAAISDKLLPLGDEVSFLCGHGPGSTIGAERRSNPYLQQGLD